MSIEFRFYMVFRDFLSIAIDQAMDTVSDIGRHVGRALVPLPDQTAMDKLVQSGRWLARTELVLRCRRYHPGMTAGKELIPIKFVL